MVNTDRHKIFGADWHNSVEINRSGFWRKQGARLKLRPLFFQNGIVVRIC